MIKEFVGLKSKLYSFLVDDNSEHKKKEGVNRNVGATKCYNDYKDVFSNNKCLRHSMNRIESKSHRAGTYENNRISLSCFHDKI